MIFTKTNNLFQVSLPPNWEDQTVHVFMGPDDSGIQHMLTLSIDPSAEGELAAYADERVDATLATLQNAEVLKEEQITLANGSEAYEVVLKWVPTDDSIIFRKQVYVILKGKGYCFAANFSKKTIKTIGVEVDRIINSLVPGIATSDDE